MSRSGAPDLIDRELVWLLQVDGRRSNSDLARRLGVSAVTIQKRIQRLVARGIIINTVSVDPTRAGAPLGVVFGLKVNHRHLSDAMEYLLREPSVLRVSKISGRFNLMAPAYFSSINEMSESVINLFTRLKGLKSSEIFFILQTGLDASIPAVRIDKQDMVLVGALAEDCRQSYADLARRVGVNPSTTRRRVSEMVRKGIIRFAASVNEDKAPWFVRGGVGLQVARTQLKPVLARLRKHPAVRFASFVTGSFDIFASIVGDSREALYEIAEEQLGRIPGVAGYEVFISEGTRIGYRWSPVKTGFRLNG